MRLASVLLAVSLITAATPVLAIEVNGSTPTFGTFECEPTFSCPSLSNGESVKAMSGTALPIATTCVAKRMALTTPKGFFETGMGLNSSLCFTTKNNIPKNENGLTMVPKCCVKPVAGVANTCQVVCTRYGVK